jgi:hypothetical protein
MIRRRSLMLAAITAASLTGCSGSIEFGRPRPPPAIVAPAGATVVETAAGEVIEERPAIETVITGLSQAQQVRTLTRALSR